MTIEYEIQTTWTYYPRLQRVAQWVEDHYSEPISVNRVADVAGLERTYFSTYFHNKTGLTFCRWLTAYRVEKAKRLLQQRHHPISEVAVAVGYGELRTFERAFKRYTGLTPKAYRDRVSIAVANAIPRMDRTRAGSPGTSK